MVRISAPLTYLLAALTLVGCGGPVPPPQPPQPHVIFIVLDNVRSDRLAQCGYERPTSPVFKRLCNRGRTRCTCDAQAPSSWTLPTHASYFTGVEVPQHGAGMGGIGDQNVRLGPGTHARPLDDRLPTLAEDFAGRGYQTLALSGNPLISPPSGLTRGFETFYHARNFGALYGAPLRDRLETLLSEQDSTQPLFLFVNIADAHRPWHHIPDGIGWVPPRPHLGFAQKPGQANPERRKFVTGEMDPQLAENMLAHLTDVYDWAVRRADQTLGGVLRVLREGGWVEGERPFRLVITSDHGEHLGEHGLLGHAGPFLFEEITRVPLAVFSNEPVGELPRQIAALAAYDLLRDGQPHRRPVRATAFSSDTWPVWYGPEIGAHPAAALWQGTLKTVHHDGRIVRYDLAADPGETQPTEWTGEAEVEELEALILALESVASGKPHDAAMVEFLKSLGYL